MSCFLPLLAAAVICAPYRLKRILAFFDPWSNARGSGFQLIQSFIALGSGGFYGVGLGGSKQKLFYLPESHTDFIFSIIGEELGFAGTASVLIIFSVLIWYLLRVSFKIKEPFYSKVVLGVGVMIAFEVIVNIGVSTGVLPTKGLPLPFVSYGGTSLITHMAAIGLILNLSREAE
jgi:cell division protein FtsW